MDERRKGGVLSRIQNLLLLGYAAKEDLRELDRYLRENYHGELVSLRHRWEELYLEALEAGRLSLGRAFKTALQTLDRLSELIHRADYGYAALLDRKGHIREEELKRVLEYDRELGRWLERLRDAVKVVAQVVKEGSWEEAPSAIDSVKVALEEMEEWWRGREALFRNL